MAAVAADDLDTARRALELINVEYRVLPFILDPSEALQPEAIAIHSGGNLAIPEPLSLERGSAEQGFAEADLVFEEHYSVPTHSATPLEPRAALASWDGDSLTLWKSTRGVHVDRDSIAGALGIPSSRLRVVGPFLGAGFGNKDESRLGAIAAVLSQRAGRPIRVEYSRAEEFVAGRTRHAAEIDLRVGVKRDGSITAIHGKALLNTGAYQASVAGVARRLGQGMLYLYRCPNVKYEAFPAYTNCPVAGSYRALGAPQGHFALETLMDRIAGELGIDPLEFRLSATTSPGRASPANASPHRTRSSTASPWKAASPSPATNWTSACAAAPRHSAGTIPCPTPATPSSSAARGWP